MRRGRHTTATSTRVSSVHASRPRSSSHLFLSRPFPFARSHCRRAIHGDEHSKGREPDAEHRGSAGECGCEAQRHIRGAASEAPDTAWATQIAGPKRTRGVSAGSIRPDVRGRRGPLARRLRPGSAAKPRPGPRASKLYSPFPVSSARFVYPFRRNCFFELFLPVRRRF